VEKDILLYVHTRNIPWARGCYRHVKVHSSPYKRGREGTCKRIQTFLELVLLAERIAISLRPNLVFERVENSTRVRVVIRIFRVSPNNALFRLICFHSSPLLIVHYIYRLQLATNASGLLTGKHVPLKKSGRSDNMRTRRNGSPSAYASGKIALSSWLVHASILTTSRVVPWISVHCNVHPAPSLILHCWHTASLLAVSYPV
jgi:hypothetical protein